MWVERPTKLNEFTDSKGQAARVQQLLQEKAELDISSVRHLASLVIHRRMNKCICE